MANLLSHKTCSKCNETKPIEKFGRSPAYRDGYRGQCSPCRSAANKLNYKPRSPEARERNNAVRRGVRATRFGVTPARFDEMFAEQENACAMCFTPKSNGKFARWHLDHCHKSGTARGILCHRCNVSLGLFEDPALRIAAETYLSRF